VLSEQTTAHTSLDLTPLLLSPLLQEQATEQAFKDPQDMAWVILSVLPQVVAVLPADEVRSHLSQIKSFLV